MICLLCFCTQCDDRSRPPSAGPATCNANGICEINSEDCTSCAQDCPCCIPVLAVGPAAVTNPTHAEGIADGKIAQIGENSALTLTLGGQVFDTAGPDFEITGTVLSNTEVTQGVCSSEGSGVGAIEVYVSDNGSFPQFLGFWTADTHTFDLGCAGLDEARVIELRGQPGASAEIDALLAQSCCDSSETCSAQRSASSQFMEDGGV
jgi:hypothetical protein